MLMVFWIGKGVLARRRRRKNMISGGILEKKCFSSPPQARKNRISDGVLKGKLSPSAPQARNFLDLRCGGNGEMCF